MRYEIVLFGVKDTTEYVLNALEERGIRIDLMVTISAEASGHHKIAGYRGLSEIAVAHGVPLFEADSYRLDDEKTAAFFAENTFGLGIVMGWQRLIPKEVLTRFRHGIFGFHGNSGYLPFGRGRSPLNWSILLGDTRFNLNLFRYDEHADSPNVFQTRTFALTAHDDIRTAQYKNMLLSVRMLYDLIDCYRAGGGIPIRTASKDFDSWYGKRTEADGRIDFHARTREIYNLIRAVAPPFPGAFCFADAKETKKVKITQARPFDEILDFSAYAPGEIVEIFDGRAVVRTVDGSLLIDRYESDAPLQKGMILY